MYANVALWNLSVERSGISEVALECFGQEFTKKTIMRKWHLKKKQIANLYRK